MGKFMPSYQWGYRFQSSPNEAVPWRVNRQHTEPAGHETPRKKLAALRGKYVDPSANPVKRGFPRSVAETQLPALPLCDGMRQNLGNEIRKIVRVLLQPCIILAVQAKKI